MRSTRKGCHTFKSPFYGIIRFCETKCFDIKKLIALVVRKKSIPEIFWNTARFLQRNFLELFRKKVIAPKGKKNRFPKFFETQHGSCNEIFRYFRTKKPTKNVTPFMHNFLITKTFPNIRRANSWNYFERQKVHHNLLWYSRPWLSKSFACNNKEVPEKFQNNGEFLNYKKTLYWFLRAVRQ